MRHYPVERATALRVARGVARWSLAGLLGLISIGNPVSADEVAPEHAAQMARSMEMFKSDVRALLNEHLGRGQDHYELDLAAGLLASA